MTVEDESRHPLTEDEPQGVIVADAQPEQLAQLVANLQRYGYETDWCYHENWPRHVRTGHTAAIVVGPNVALSDTLDVCRSVRRSTEVPVIVLAAEGGLDQAARVLDAGADVYLVGAAEVAARTVMSAINAVQRRERLARQSDEEIVEVGPLRIDLRRKVVEVNDKRIALTATEFGILGLLAQRPGHVVNAAEIVRHVHGYEPHEGDAQDIVKVHISRLRQKLEETPELQRCIVNIRGQGYTYMFERRTHIRERADRAISARQQAS